MAITNVYKDNNRLVITEDGNVYGRSIVFADTVVSAIESSGQYKVLNLHYRTSDGFIIVTYTDGTTQSEIAIDPSGGGVSDHDSLTGVTASQHHTKYTDAEVDTIVAVHAALANAHHARYTDPEAVTAAKTVKLDDFTTPDDNTDLDVSTTKHGLVPKGINTGKFLKDDGTWAAAGASTWLGLADTPASFSGQKGKQAVANAAEDAIEFGELSVSLADASYWVDSVNGDDSNAGTEANPFQTLAKAVSMIPRIVLHNITIWLEAQTWAEDLIVHDRLILGALTIKGNTATGTNHKIQQISIVDVHGQLILRYLEATKTGAHAIVIHGSGPYILIHGVTVDDADGSYFGLQASRGSNVWVLESTFSNRGVGIFADYNSVVLSSLNEGSGNTYGLWARRGGVIYKFDNAQPTGTNRNEYATQGGQIIDDHYIALTETTTPIADADRGKIYTKSDNKLYFQDGAGNEHLISNVGDAPAAHKDTHDPEDGSDPLDTAVPVAIGSANAIGDSHSLARANHVHAREHAKYTDAEATTQAKAIKRSYSITVENPDGSEDITIGFTEKAITITEIRAVLIGSATPSVTWTIRHHATDRNNAGNEVVTGGTVTTSTTGGSDVTSFDDATIPADSFIWLETTAQSGTVTEIAITIVYTVD